MTTAEKTTGERIEELMKKGFTKLSTQEKAELNNLLAQNLEDSKQENFNNVIAEIKQIITKNELEISDVVKALSGQAITTEVAYFEVPYKDTKGKDKKYLWWFGKPTVGKSGSYYKKLKDATEGEKRAWATPKGLEWLETEQGKTWLKS
ncbi:MULTISPECIES: hypothetical protein [Burkholderia]|uniref:hypothetical protein n=1 Tax=Burkholderia TaxID=32008 RepID=UPI001640665F|nr:hypothetical protein [Burkholderia gladioli]